MPNNNNAAAAGRSGDSSIDNLCNGAIERSLSSPTQAISVLQTLIKTYEEVHRIDESEKTKRKDIERQRQVALAQIGAQKDILIKYLNCSFSERKRVFNKIFRVVDDAISKRDNEQLALGLKTMNEIAASSPFGPLKEIMSTKKALEQKGHQWDF